MKSRWSERDADALTRDYAARGVAGDVAMRVYSSRLLGRDGRLVLHGGGNTSVKTRMTDAAGEETDVLCVKGSGWDLAEIEPAGLPAVRMNALLRLRRLKALSDEDMINVQRGALLDSSAPNPSIETLLHAFLPHKFVDHTHADAILAVTDQPEAEARCRDLFGPRAAPVPYVMPGFALALECARVLEERPDVEGLILVKHGIFSFGETARESYERMIDLVTVAERRVARAPKAMPPARPRRLAAQVEDLAPVLRGAVAERMDGDWRRLILEFRDSKSVREYVDGSDLGRYAAAGPATPDHVIRTKPKPLILPPNLAAIRGAVADYARDYQKYFRRNDRRKDKRPLDPMPRVVLAPGLGLFGLGKSAREARIAADLAETTARVTVDAERVGRYESISERDIFDVEYWSLEQAKLCKAAEKPLARHVVAVTGGGSGIGRATVAAFARAGAEVAVLDNDREAAKAAAGEVDGLAVHCDVTRGPSVKSAFAAVCRAYGGIDVLVSNAGAAWQGRIGDVDEKILRRSFELNFWGHQRCAQAAVAIMKAQGTGGALLFNASKQAVSPGRDFGPYGLPKASTLFLSRQYALDHGADGIRSNAVNADRIRSGLLTDGMIASRAAARGVSEAEYMSGNLLGTEVTAEDVAQAFVGLAMAKKTTGAVMAVDGGNIAAAPR